MARGGNVKVRFGADTSDLDRGSRSASGTLDKFERSGSSSFNRLGKSADKSGERFKKFGKVGAAAFAGIGVAAGVAAAAGLKSAATAAIEAEKSQARLKAQLKASDIGFKAHAKQIDEVIQKHSQLSGLDDEDLQDSFTNIVRVTGDVSKSLRLTGLAADFARAKHMDVAKAGELLGKVAGGNVGILSRYGMAVEPVTTAQDALAKSTGKVTDAQRKAAAEADKQATVQGALASLQKKFGGQAEAYGRTTGGSVDRASVAWENLLEIVGAKIAPVIVKVTDLFTVLFTRSSQGNKIIRGVGEGYVKYLGWVRDALQNAIAFVKRFMTENREALHDVVRAMKNVAQFAKAVFEDVVIPILKRIAPIARDMAQGILKTIGGMIRLVTALINGDWSKAWDAFKDIIRNVAETYNRVMAKIGKLILEGLGKIPPLALKAAKAIGSAIVKGIVAGIKSAGNAVGNAVTGVLGKVNPFGDGVGIGKRIGDSMGVTGLGGGGGLDGADPDLAPFAAAGSRFGLHVSSGLRVGAITSSGNPSYHGTGDAIDETGPPAGMLAYFRFMKKTFGSRLRELIYTPGGAGIKDGKPFTYTGQVASDHYDHVHVAYTGPFGDGFGRKPRTGDGEGVSPGKKVYNRFYRWATANRDPRSPATGYWTGMLTDWFGFNPNTPRNRDRIGSVSPEAWRDWWRKGNKYNARGDGPGRKRGTGDGPGLNRTFPKHGLSDAAGHFQMTSRQVRGVAEAAGFPAGVALQMDQIAQGESTRYPGIVSYDGGYGLWQMTPRVWGAAAKSAMARLGGLGAMLNPFKNAKMAKWLYDDAGGFGPWYGTRFLNRGMDTSKVKSVLGKGGAVPGGGGTGGAAKEVKVPVGSQRTNAVGGLRGERPTPIGLGTEGELGLATVAVSKAKAERRDDLGGLIKALVDERAIKRRRLKRIRKVLKGRLGKARRVRLVQEEAQLISEIGELTESIKEYKADAKGGATTITRADELEAGVDTSIDKPPLDEPPPVEPVAPDPALEEHNRLLEQQNALMAEQNANQQKILALAGQGPAILASVVAAVNGGIGGPVGLGFSTPGYAGGGVRY